MYSPLRVFDNLCNYLLVLNDSFVRANACAGAA